ncbi:MAG: outer membrane beta-barrel protein [Elusimicrobiota bacterium]|jgi:outer membrane protein|nr:outer membrane beta-barrel protein [Elusimicrobiota bacterium]
MKKLALAVFAVAVFATAAVAQGFTLGGQVGFDYAKNKVSGVDVKTTSFSIAPEVGFILNETTNIGFNVSYGYSKVSGGGASAKITDIGFDVFGEKAVLDPGPFKVYLRADLGFDNRKTDGVSDKTNSIAFSILPNIQYALSDRLTLIVSSDVLRLGVGYTKTGGDKTTSFGFNVGNGNITNVGLKYAF